MTDYKVGDKVKILNSLGLRKAYRSVKFAKFFGVENGGYLRIKMADGNTQFISRENIELAEPEELTFIQLIEKLPELAVGTKFKGSTGDLYVDYQKDSFSDTNKFFYWKSGDKPVAVSEVVLKAKFTQLPAERPKPKYIEITWQEALQIVVDGGIVYADYNKTIVDMHTYIADEISITDIYDVTVGTNWYKRTE